jgi:hypothetical protein
MVNSSLIKPSQDYSWRRQNFDLPSVSPKKITAGHSPKAAHRDPLENHLVPWLLAAQLTVCLTVQSFTWDAYSQTAYAIN